MEGGRYSDYKLAMRLSPKTWVAYGLVAFAFGTGGVLSVGSGDWTWFARAGSLVVAIGIVLTSSQIIEHNRRLRQRRVDIERQLRRQTQLSTSANRDWAGDDSIRSLLRSRTREEYAWEIEGHGLYMLVVGTLVWGFGDLLGALFGG